MRLPVCRTIGLLLLTLVPVLSHALEPDKVFDKVSPSAWAVITAGPGKPVVLGSAVVVGPGKLITNCHVLRNGRTFQITKDNVTYGASLGAADLERNLCQILVANFKAPAPEFANLQKLKTGQKVFAITNPDGQESTLSEGLISSVRQQDESGLTAIQTSAPVSAGSSGGGLYDTDGRLVGIITTGSKPGQSFNIARPAAWIHEVEQRAKSAPPTAEIKNTARPVVASSVVSASSLGAVQLGEAYVYLLTDRTTKIKRTVSYRVDQIDAAADRILFNQGARVEDSKGNVIKLNAVQGGLFESTMPPTGWINLPLTPGKTWREVYTVPQVGQAKLSATVLGDEKLVTPAGEFDAIKIQWKGWVTGESVLGGRSNTAASSYTTYVWYSPQLNRIVKFTADKVDSFNKGEREVLELLRRGPEQKY